MPPFDELTNPRPSETQPGHNLGHCLLLAGRLVPDTDYSVLIGANILLPLTLRLALGESQSLAR